MMSWLMLSTFCQFTVTPAACASGASPALRPSMTGLSMLAQIVTVDPFTSPWGLLPLDEEPDPPELRQADVSAIVAPSAANTLRRLGPRISAPSSSNGSGAGASR